MLSPPEADLEAKFRQPSTNPPIDGRTALRSRQWIIWHVLEHDRRRAGPAADVLAPRTDASFEEHGTTVEFPSPSRGG